jgi:hypothetical protein
VNGRKQERLHGGRKTLSVVLKLHVTQVHFVVAVQEVGQPSVSPHVE